MRLDSGTKRVKHKSGGRKAQTKQELLRFNKWDLRRFYGAVDIFLGVTFFSILQLVMTPFFTN